MCAYASGVAKHLPQSDQSLIDVLERADNSLNGIPRRRRIVKTAQRIPATLVRRGHRCGLRRDLQRRAEARVHLL